MRCVAAHALVRSDVTSLCALMSHRLILRRTSSAIFNRRYASGTSRRASVPFGGHLLRSTRKGEGNRMRIRMHAIPTWAALACALIGLSACEEPQAEDRKSVV